MCCIQTLVLASKTCCKRKNLKCSLINTLCCFTSCCVPAAAVWLEEEEEEEVQRVCRSLNVTVFCSSVLETYQTVNCSEVINSARLGHHTWLNKHLICRYCGTLQQVRGDKHELETWGVQTFSVLEQQRPHRQEITEQQQEKFHSMVEYEF